MTGERIECSNTVNVTRRMVGRTIAAIEVDHWKIAVRFEDGSWALGSFVQGRDEATEIDWRSDIMRELHALVRIGVMAEEERRTMVEEESAREAKRARDQRFYQYEQLRKEFEGEAQ